MIDGSNTYNKLDAPPFQTHGSFLGFIEDTGTATCVGGAIPFSIIACTNYSNRGGYAASWSGPSIFFSKSGHATLDIHCEVETLTDNIFMWCPTGPNANNVVGFTNSFFFDANSEATNSVISYDTLGKFGVPIRAFSAANSSVNVGFGSAPAFNAQVFDDHSAFTGSHVWHGDIYVGGALRTADVHWLGNFPDDRQGRLMLSDDKTNFSGDLISGGTLTSGGIVSAGSDITAGGWVYGASGLAIGPVGFPQGRLTFDGTQINSNVPISLPPGSTGAFLPLTGGTVSGATTFSGGLTASAINSTPIGATTPSTGAFTNLSATGTVALPTTTTGPFLLLTGGTVTGATTFNSTLTVGALTLNASPTHITGAAGTFRTLRFETGGSARFSFGLDNTAEGGTADGSNFVVSSFDNSGNAVNNAFFSLNRLTGRTSTLGITQTAAIAAANIGSGTGTGFVQNGSVSGSKAIASYTGINQWNISSDVGALTGQFLFNTAINYNFGGAGYTGNRGGLLILMTQTGVAAGTSGAGGIEALQASVTINNTFGGTNSGVGAAGAVFAGNLSTRLTSGATNIIGSCGLEIDVEADTGATYQSATGLAVVATTAHKQAGVLKANTAVIVGAQTGSNGFEIGYAVSSWGLGASGTVFLADFAADKPTFTVTRGFDLRALTTTSDIFAASGFAIGPTGRVRVGTGYFDVTATGAGLSADGAICTAGTLTGSVATTFASDGNSYYVDDPYGGMWIVTFPNGTSSITAITLVSAPVVKGTPPANPITLTPRGRLNVFAPGAITANFTWDTTRISLAVQSLSTGKLGFFGSTPVVKPTGWGTSTGGARAAITASSTLPQVAAGLAQLLNDLTAYGLIGV